MKKEGQKKLEAPSCEATVIKRVIEVEKHPREETSDYMISQRETSRSKVRSATAFRGLR